MVAVSGFRFLKSNSPEKVDEEAVEAHGVRPYRVHSYQNLPTSRSTTLEKGT